MQKRRRIAPDDPVGEVHLVVAERRLALDLVSQYAADLPGRGGRQVEVSLQRAFGGQTSDDFREPDPRVAEKPHHVLARRIEREPADLARAAAPLDGEDGLARAARDDQGVHLGSHGAAQSNRHHARELGQPPAH